MENLSQDLSNCPAVGRSLVRNPNDAYFAEILILNVALNVAFTLSASIGNGMIVVAILRSQNLQTPSYLLITSLAFTDLLVGLVFHPLQILLNTFTLKSDIQGVCEVAKPYIFFTVYLFFVSLLTVTCISVDRYLALYLRHRYTIIVTKKRVRLSILFAHVFAIFLGILALEKVIDYFMILGCCLATLLLFITCVFYIKSFRALHLYTVQVHTQQANTLAGNFDVVRYKKTLKTMLVVLVCLLLCYVPLLCTLVSRISTEDHPLVIKLYDVSLTLTGLNSSINPFVYLIRFTDIRNACREMLRNLVTCFS